MVLSCLPLQALEISQKEPEDKILRITFQGGLKKILTQNASLLLGKANLLTFEGYQDKANYALVPQISIISFIAPNFKSTGDPLRSERDYTKWGPTLAFKTQIIWPFYSFGRLTLGKKAAEQGLKASKYLHEAEINNVIFDYKKLYCSLIALQQVQSLLEEAKEQSGKILSEAQKQYATGEGKILRKDISRLKIYTLELQKREEEHRANQKSAQLALAHLLGEKVFYEAYDENFPDIETDSFLLRNLIDLSFKKKPILKGLKLGILARENLLDIEKKGLLPVFFIGAEVVANYTPIREVQQSSFAYDPHNRRIAGIAAGLKWDFDWGKYKLNIKKAQAEYEKLLAQKKQADTGYPLEISIAFWGMEKDRNVWRLSQKKLGEARKWSTSEFTAYSSGLSDAKDLIESLATYYLTKREVIEAEYNYLVSWATLSLKVGELAMLKAW